MCVQDPMMMLPGQGSGGTTTNGPSPLASSTAADGLSTFSFSTQTSVTAGGCGWGRLGRPQRHGQACSATCTHAPMPPCSFPLHSLPQCSQRCLVCTCEAALKGLGMRSSKHDLLLLPSCSWPLQHLHSPGNCLLSCLAWSSWTIPGTQPFRLCATWCGGLRYWAWLLPITEHQQALSTSKQLYIYIWP